jgi:hypothetical protein
MALATLDSFQRLFLGSEKVYGALGSMVPERSAGVFVGAGRNDTKPSSAASGR